MMLEKLTLLTASGRLNPNFSRSGIFVPTGTTLTITAQSTGKLIARGGLYHDGQTQIASAGIGGPSAYGWNIDAGTINIKGGIIEAYGAETYDIGVGGTVNITGGVVRFGNGKIEEHVTKNNCIVFIKNLGTIYGESCELPNDLEIKKGDELTISAEITLTNNSTVTNNGCFYNYGNIEGKGDIVNNGVMYLGQSTITPSGEEVLDGKIEGGIAGKDYLFDLSSEGVLMTIKTKEVKALKGDFKNWSIDIDVSSTSSDDAPEITLKNVKIDASGRNEFAIRALQNATLILEPGTQNYLYGDADAAGLLVAEVAQLTIKGTGRLEVESGSGRGAAIGGRYNQRVGVIEIESGNIVAKSKGSGSAIGTGVSGSCKEINISGGELTLKGAVKASALKITGGIFRLDKSNSKTLDKASDRTCLVFVENEGTVYGNYTLQQNLELTGEQSLNIPDETSLNMGSYQLTGDGYLKGYIPESWKGRVEVTLYNDGQELKPRSILKDGEELPSIEGYKKGNHKCIGWSLTAGGGLAEKYQVRYGKETNNLYLKWEPKKKLTADDFVFKNPEGLVYNGDYQEIEPPVSLENPEGKGQVYCGYEYSYEEYGGWRWCYSIEYAGTYRVLVSMDESEEYQSMDEELVDEYWVFTVAPKEIKVTPAAEQVFFEGDEDATIAYTVEDGVYCEGTLALKPKEDGEGYQYGMGSLEVDYWYERNYKLKLEDVEVTVYECSPNEVEATIASDNATEYGWAKEAIILSAPKGFVFADDGNESKQFEVEGSYSLKLKKGDDVTTYEHQLPIDKNDPVIEEVTTNNLSFTIKVMDELSGIAEVKLGDMALKQTAEGVYSGTANAGTYIIKVTDKAGNSVEGSVTLEAKEFDITLEEVSGGKIYAKSKAVAGETVTLRCEEHNNYDFVRWEVKETGSGKAVQVDGNTFTMPAAAVTVSAVFRYDPPYVPPVDPTYYDIHFEANDSVLLSSDQETVEAGHSLTITVEAAEGYDPATLVVEYRSGRYGSWRTLAPDSNGDYRIASVYNDIYIRARIERLEDPTANEQVDAATSRVWATGSRLCITLTEPQKLHIVSMEGRLLRTEQLPVGYSEITGLPAGVHIVLLSDGLRKKVVIR